MSRRVTAGRARPELPNPLRPAAGTRPRPLPVPAALATLELAVRPLDLRQAARLWGIDDSRLALLVHAVVGGAPAYRYEFVSDDTPTGPDDFDGSSTHWW
ncbi:hypothetical protein ABZ208_33775 [Streptomyces sp. NPDC006208]|uniref:hypothetical protein n=1 Tax=Streptomyces sp. NPDC006208 TaxID=3156734 RepID=UPI0033A89E48